MAEATLVIPGNEVKLMQTLSDTRKKTLLEIMASMKQLSRLNSCDVEWTADKNGITSRCKLKLQVNSNKLYVTVPLSRKQPAREVKLYFQKNQGNIECCCDPGTAVRGPVKDQPLNKNQFSNAIARFFRTYITRESIQNKITNRLISNSYHSKVSSVMSRLPDGKQSFSETGISTYDFDKSKRVLRLHDIQISIENVSMGCSFSIAHDTDQLIFTLDSVDTNLVKYPKLNKNKVLSECIRVFYKNYLPELETKHNSASLQTLHAVPHDAAPANIIETLQSNQVAHLNTHIFHRTNHGRLAVGPVAK